VLITAGAQGIGRATADAFLASGARVHIADCNEDAVAEYLAPGRATGTVADCSDKAHVDAVFQDALHSLGGIDVLVNCVGIPGPVCPVEEVALEDWQRTLQVNLDSALLCSQRAVAHMKYQGRGAIISLSSTAGLMGCPRRVPYAAAKWALIGMTKSLAMELGPHGISVNAVCPTSTDGPRIDRVIAAASETLGTTPEAVRHAWKAQVSMKCFVTAEEIAQTIVFLAGEGARHISGQAIAVDGHTETLGDVGVAEMIELARLQAANEDADAMSAAA
jgi:NAD(P)-dependent dehydrogenase (short-subunit alcohol dehydrogenase family)